MAFLNFIFQPKNELEDGGRAAAAPGLQADVPEEPEITCPNCHKSFPESKINSNMHVCQCGHHFRINARTRISYIADEGSFYELFADVSSKDPIGFPGYEKKLESTRQASGENEAVVTGTAMINGIPCAMFVMEPYFMMGSMGTAVGEKITSLFEYATEQKLPVIGFTVSGGARMQEGLSSLMQMAKCSGAVKRHSDAGLLYITVLTDPTTGGVTASFAMEGDIILAEPGATVGFAGARVIEQTTRKILPKGFQTAEFLMEHGFVDNIAPRRGQKKILQKILEMHANVREAVKVEIEEPESLDKVSKEQAEKAAYDIVKIARGNKRPTSADYISNIFTDFIELHGDRRFSDDPAIIGGIAKLGGMPVTVIGIEKGRNTKERMQRAFGAPNPEGYRKALRLMKQAEKFNRPVVCLVDTSGAYCGIGAEERGEGLAIAENLMEMMTLRTPVISVVIGEGGSGGALALAVADEVWMLENSIYSVISPEGCASILWKDSSKAAVAAEVLKLTARDSLETGLIEKIISEENIEIRSVYFAELKNMLIDKFGELNEVPLDELTENRYQRFRRIGA